MEHMPGRVAVVTGGASGIGRALAARFLAEGMHVVIGDVEVGALEATVSELGAVGIPTDVSDASQVQALADSTIGRFGRVDVLCNNAGVGGGGMVAELELADWQWVLTVNLWGVIHGIQSFLPHLLDNPAGGHIVNTASMAGLFPLPGAAPYAASKYAVVGLSESLQAELEQMGAAVRVSVLCPGFVRTNIFTSQRNRPDSLKVAGRSPLMSARASNDEMIRIVDENALPPEQVAADVLDAIVHDRFWIFTHPDLLDSIEERHAAILASRDAGP
jgi:NAD(P)-dependent dehydrogenase (short-subunit alcohol dehydrogenase family)